MNKVLIVDDDVDFAESLKSLLESHNYSSIAAHNEKEALESIRMNNVGLVLLDVKLGKGCGINLLQKIIKVRPKTRCIMITGYASVDMAIQSIRAGARDFLRKPINMEVLLASLKKGQTFNSSPSNYCSEKGIEPFLNEASTRIENHFPGYTGSVTFHIRDGKLASWESKTGGRCKE